MDRAALERYDRRIPRYTSYPTAPHFHAGVTADAYLRWLGRLGPETPLSLYFHVPFCHEMCWYCGCHTKVVRRYQPVGDYASLLAAEVDLVARAIPRRAPVSHIHWGGGTPTILSQEDCTRLMESVRRRYTVAPDAEIAIEIDPRRVNGATVATLAQVGVNRVSLGVQEFSATVQKAINRIQPFEMTERVVDRLRRAGIDAINIDLMYGLPHQTVADVRRSVDLVARLRPARVAVFGYAHVPWMKTHQRMIPDEALPSSSERLEQAAAGSARLLEHGYRRIGLDHFALPDDAMSRALDAGRLHRNFQGYTTDRAETLIGFGASSIGATPEGYVQNAAPLHDYADAIRRERPATVKGFVLSEEDRLRRAVIERLMCDLKVDLGAMANQYGKGELHFAAEVAAVAPMIEDGIAECDGNRLRITERGRPLMRAVCAVFDQYLDNGAVRHSKAV